jgi:hypothetical protein
MVKGEEMSIRAMFDSMGLQPVYSDENIDEINRSKSRREQFLDLLVRLGAKHVYIPLDENFKPSEVIEIYTKNPRDRLAELVEARRGYELLESGLDSLTKIYGGLESSTMTEIASSQLDSVEKMLKEQLLTPDIDDPELAEGKAMLEKLLVDLTATRARTISGLSELDAMCKQRPLLQQVQEELEIGPIQLNNVKPPNEIEQIWAMVGHAYGAPSKNFMEFVQTALSLRDENGRSQPKTFQLVNAIYNWLNMIGFYRDEKMHKPSRTKASFGDMTHAGYGIACDHFYCDDMRMRRKISATYEYLNLKTKIQELTLSK